MRRGNAAHAQQPECKHPSQSQNLRPARHSAGPRAGLFQITQSGSSRGNRRSSTRKGVPPALQIRQSLQEPLLQLQMQTPWVRHPSIPSLGSSSVRLLASFWQGLIQAHTMQSARHGSHPLQAVNLCTLAAASLHCICCAFSDHAQLDSLPSE